MRATRKMRAALAAVLAIQLLGSAAAVAQQPPAPATPPAPAAVAQQPPAAAPPAPAVVDALGRALDGVAAETLQRLAGDARGPTPAVVRAGNGRGVEPVVSELLRTRLVERGATVEVACPARCLEVTLTEFAPGEAAAAGLAGQVLPLAGAAALLGAPQRAAGERDAATTRTLALLVTFALREGNRYVQRSHVVAVVSAPRGAAQ